MMRSAGPVFGANYGISVGLWADQSGFAPENFTTFAHFLVSSMRSLPKSMGEMGSTLEPSSAYRALILESASPALISRLSLSIISGGVLLGAPRPNQRFDSYPGTNSARVGRSGNASARPVLVTASGRILPALMYSIVSVMPAK